MEPTAGVYGQGACFPGSCQGLAEIAEGAWGVSLCPGPVPLAPLRSGLPIHLRAHGPVHHRL